MTCRSAGVRGLWSAARRCPSRALVRAPVSRSRPPSPARPPSLALPLASRGPFVCRRPRPVGELALGLAHPLAGGPDAGLLALQRGGARGDLEQPQLLGGQRWLLVGVVLAATEQTPEQARELARRGDD